MAKEYKIFISHSWQRTDTLESLRRLLNERSYFYASYEESTRENPINSQNETYVKQTLREKISRSNIVLALAGIYASHSSWMAWELETASKRGIPIVGIIPRGQERISSLVYTHSIRDVRWNTEAIVSAIRSHAI